MKENIKIHLDNLNLLDSQEKYLYLVELAQHLPNFGINIKNSKNLIDSCTSKVWLKIEIINQKINFQAESDSLLIRGILYLIYLQLQNLDIKKYNFSILKCIKNNQTIKNLTIARKSGLKAIFDKIKDKINLQK